MVDPGRAQLPRSVRLSEAVRRPEDDSTASVDGVRVQHARQRVRPRVLTCVSLIELSVVSLACGTSHAVLHFLSKGARCVLGLLSTMVVFRCLHVCRRVTPNPTRGCCGLAGISASRSTPIRSFHPETRKYSFCGSTQVRSAGARSQSMQTLVGDGFGGRTGE
eukprot:2646647-Rhodomonas_salina.1